MSKLIDKLNQASRIVSQSVGFRAAQTALRKPKILLIAGLSDVDVDGLADYVTGADAGLLPIPDLTSGAENIRKMCQVMPDVPWGGWLSNVGSERIEQIEESGCDFVVFPAVDTSLTVLQNGEVGKILQVDTSLSEGLLRTINELSVDAVLIITEQKDSYLSWHHLMIFRYFADLFTKPLLASVPSNTTASELQAVWEAGVSGVVVEVGEAGGRTKELRHEIDKLTFPPQRKRGKAGVIIPHISGEEDRGEEE